MRGVRRRHGESDVACASQRRSPENVALGPRSWQTASVSAHVRLTGELTGKYVVDEVYEDGRIVLRPDTSAAAIRERAGLDPVTDDEFERAFGDLPSDSEG